ncbi:1,4-dihydroxy-2-naphthoate polyprenyltransferase [Bacillaceae bacterium Marseille-Q3522]|nr:1,4-dihydroxy-2-naphthoate polyprenyltransferase [Bacillaceae bacterium Marseille-Q3522]
MQPQVDTSSPPIIKSKSWRVWGQLTKPHTLTTAIIPVIIGTVLALEVHASLHFLLFIAMLTASLFIQIATNLFNEYYDYKRGLDHAGSVGIGGGIVREGIRPKTIMNLALSLYILSIVIGVYICISTSWWLGLIGLVCMAAGYLYTGGPFPIAYTPFGELISGLFMGMFIILISYYIQTGNVSVYSVLISIPVMVLVGSINLANNMRDLDGDKENGRKTLAILIGRKKAIYLLGSMFIFSYCWTVALMLFSQLSPWMLLVLLSIPKALQAVKGFIGKTKPIQMMPAMKATSQTNTFFGLLLAIGIVISYLFM